VTPGAADLAGQLVLGAPVLSVQKPQHVYTLDETDILLGKMAAHWKGAPANMLETVRVCL